MATVQDMFREYLYLDGKRTREGVTPEELERWKRLRMRLDRCFAGGPGKASAERRDSLRVPTRMKLCFDSKEGLRNALMTNLSRGGVFVNTAFPAAPGTRLELRIRVESSGELLEIPAEVASNHVGSGYETGKLGMGVRFLTLSPQLRRKIDDLYAELALAAAEASEKPGDD